MTMAAAGLAEGAMALPTGEKVAVKVRKRADGSLATEVSAPAWVEIDETIDVAQMK